MSFLVVVVSVELLDARCVGPSFAVYFYVIQGCLIIKNNNNNNNNNNDNNNNNNNNNNMSLCTG